MLQVLKNAQYKPFSHRQNDQGFSQLSEQTYFITFSRTSFSCRTRPNLLPSLPSRESVFMCARMQMRVCVREREREREREGERKKERERIGIAVDIAS